MLISVSWFTAGGPHPAQHSPDAEPYLLLHALVIPPHQETITGQYLWHLCTHCAKHMLFLPGELWINLLGPAADSTTPWLCDLEQVT